MKNALAFDINNKLIAFEDPCNIIVANYGEIVG